jgi:hypothetical protein
MGSQGCQTKMMCNIAGYRTHRDMCKKRETRRVWFPSLIDEMIGYDGLEVGISQRDRQQAIDGGPRSDSAWK